MPSTIPPETAPIHREPADGAGRAGWSFLRRAFGFVACAVTALGLHRPFAQTIVGATDGGSLFVTIIVPVVAAALLYAISALLLLGLWRHPFRSRHHGLGGGSLAFCLLLFVLQSIALAADVLHTPMVVRNWSAAAAFTYDLTGDPALKRVHLRGDIGKGLLSRLKAFESEFGSIAVFEIASFGGLVDEALDVADFLEQRAITVIAREMCDSACVFVAIASKESVCRPLVALRISWRDEPCRQ